MDIFGFSLLQSFNSISYRLCLELRRNGALMATLEVSFNFSNYLPQVNRFFNPIIQWFAATSNPEKQRLRIFVGSSLGFFFSYQQSIFYPLLEKYFILSLIFLKTDVPACPVFFSLLQWEIRFSENWFLYYLVMLVATTTISFSAVHECIIQCIVPYIK